MLAVMAITTPAFGRSFFGRDIDVGLDALSSVLGGEAFLERVFNALWGSRTRPPLLTWASTQHARIR